MLVQTSAAAVLTCWPGDAGTARTRHTATDAFTTRYLNARSEISPNLDLPNAEKNHQPTSLTIVV
jgi:hypothetical protein